MTEKKDIQQNKELQMYISEIANRLQLAATMGVSHNGERDMYSILGYPKQLTYTHYRQVYERGDIGSAIIDRPIEMTWKGDLNVFVSNEVDKKDVLWTQWKELRDRMGLADIFVRADTLASIGRYGVILLGFDDVVNADIDFQKPVEGKRNLLYATPYSEQAAIIHRIVTDPKDERYGLPLFYQVSIANADGQGSRTIMVHYSRIIHIITKKLESEIYGIPVLQRVYNRLVDLEKIVGSDAETFWRLVKNIVTGKVNEDYTIDSTAKDNLEDQLAEVEHGLRRVLIQEGVDLNVLRQQLQDPMNHVEIQLMLISAVTGIPKRILVGSERGELASSQDYDSYMDKITSRREQYAEIQIVRAFVDRLMQYGALYKFKEYTVEWSNLYSVTDKDKAEVGKSRASALKEYASQPGAAEILPPQSFLRLILGLTEEQIQEVETEQMAFQIEEDETRGMETELEDDFSEGN